MKNYLNSHQTHMPPLLLLVLRIHPSYDLMCRVLLDLHLAADNYTAGDSCTILTMHLQSQIVQQKRRGQT